MTPQPDQHIVVFLRVGVQLDGIVVSWADEQSVLKSTNGSTMTVIQNTLADVVYYKIMNDQKIKKEFETVKQKPTKTENDIQTLAELRKELNDIEREEIANKIKSHDISLPKQTAYDLPSFFRAPSHEQHSPEETPKPDTKFSEGLQGLFSKTRNP